MHVSLRTLAASSLSIVAVAVSSGLAAAAPRPACDVVTAAQASGIIGKAVTARAMPPSGVSSVCMYLSGGRPVIQLGLTDMGSAATAAEIFKGQQQAAAAHPRTANRLKGSIVLSAFAHSSDKATMNALLDAAVKNL
jgi:hypothetical protein